MASYHHGDLPAAILTAARRFLEADAAEGLSLRALANAVGVSPNAPYRHFPTKEDLLAALAAQGFDELTARFLPYKTADAAARMKGYLEAYLSFARENPGLYRLMFGRRLDPLANATQLSEHAQACFTALMAAVAALIARPMSDPRVREDAAIVWSLSHGAALLDIDRATAFLAEPERPTAASLARVLVSGMLG